MNQLQNAQGWNFQRELKTLQILFLKLSCWFIKIKATIFDETHQATRDVRGLKKTE